MTIPLTLAEFERAAIESIKSWRFPMGDHVVPTEDGVARMRELFLAFAAGAVLGGEVMSDTTADGRGRALRHLCHGIGVVVAQAIAEADVSLSEIGARLGWPREKVNRLIMRLLDGKPISLDAISDLLFACGGVELHMKMVVRIVPRENDDAP